MHSYQELVAQRVLLDQKIAAARETELTDAVAKVRDLVSQYDMTIEDVFPPSRRSTKAGTKVAPKYRDPSTGMTWTGRGKAPKWFAVASEEQRQAFVIV